MAGRLVSPITIGRRAELDSAVGALDAAMRGAPVHVLVAGEAGVGKSRLVGELSVAATDRGVRVLRGACANVGEEGLPYGPIVELLGELTRSLSPSDLEAVVGSAGPDLARLAPALDTRAVVAPVQPTWVQTRLFDALLATFRRLASLAPVLLLVEDIHWSDPATRETLGFLVRSLRTDPVLIVMTLRTDELHRRHPALPWLAELERTDRVQRIPLARLDAAQTAAMLEAIEGAPGDPELAARIHRRSDGNPFFIEELLLAETSAQPARLSSTLREILLARLDAVPEPVGSVLGIVAVAGRRIDHDLLETIASPEDPSALDEALRTAIASQILVVERDMSGEGYAFRHALLAEVAYDELLPGERRRLHRACALALEASPPASGGMLAAHRAELAHHWMHAHDDERAFEASLRAAEAAEKAFAFEAALRQYERALELWDDVADPAGVSAGDHPAMLARAANAAYLAGLAHREVALQRQAIASLPPDADPVRVATLRERLSRYLWIAGDSAHALTESEAAVELMPADPPSAERAQVLAGYGQLLMLLDRWDVARAKCEEAVDIAVRVGAREAEGHARNSLGLALVAQGFTSEGLSSIEHAIVIAREVGSVDDIGRGHVNLASALIFAGELHRAVAAAAEGVRESDLYGISSTYGKFIMANALQAQFELGDWDSAAATADELDLVHAMRPLSRYGLARWVPLLVARGETELARSQLDRLGELLRGTPVEAQFHAAYHAAAAEFELWEGRPDAALRIVTEGLRGLEAASWTWYHLRLHRVGAWAAADIAEVARARRDPDAEGRALAAAATMQAGRQAHVEGTLAALSGPQADENRAEAATADAEDLRLVGEADPGAWRAVADLWRARERPYLVAYARAREAEAAMATGSRADAEAALGEADRIAARLGARPLRAAIASLALRARINLGAGDAADAGDRTSGDGDGASQPRTAARADPYGLTRREREVLGLVTLGRTNRQIADALFISENTAGVHVSNILGKLGVASRTEAAAIAARAGYEAPEPVVDEAS